MAEHGVAWAMNTDDPWDAADLRHLAAVGMIASGSLSSISGKRPGPGLELTLDGSGQPVVAAGLGQIAGPANGDGCYGFAVPAAVTLTAPPLAGAGLKRHDRIVVQLRDADVAAFGTALREVSVERVAGTEAASPSPASEPLGALTVGLVEVTASGRTLLPHTVPRIAAAGGIVLVANTAARDALPAHDGMVVYREDIDTLQIRTGGAWTDVLPQEPTRGVRTANTNASGDITITHGLGAVPSSVQLTQRTHGIHRISSVTSTTITVQCMDVNGNARGSGFTVTLDWVAYP